MGGINMKEKEITFTKKDVESMSFSRGSYYYTITFRLNDGKQLRVSPNELMTLFRASNTKKFKAFLKRKYYHLEKYI
tara:strand:+ start:522 stop:752 length:231 start_codon:yes stop_codon:yes gene_type:complete